MEFEVNLWNKYQKSAESASSRTQNIYNMKIKINVVIR